MSINYAVAFEFAKKIIASRRFTVSRRAFFTAMICIALCVVPFVVTASVASSMTRAMMAKAVQLSSGQVFIKLRPPRTPTPQSQNATDPRLLAASLKQETSKAFPNLTFYPQVQSTAILASSSKRSGCLLRAVDSAFLAQDAITLVGVDKTAIDKIFHNKNSVVLSSYLSKTLNLTAGEKVRVITNASADVTGAFKPRVTLCTVAAIFTTGYEELDRLWAFVNLGGAKAFSSGAFSKPTILVDTGTVLPADKDATAIKATLTKALGTRGAAFTWKEVNATLCENLNSTQALLTVVTALIVLVALTNIASAVSMMAHEREGECFALFCFGVNALTVRAAFAFVAAALVAASLVVGVLIGVALSLLSGVVIASLDSAFYITSVKVSVDVASIAFLSAFALLYAVLAAILVPIKKL